MFSDGLVELLEIVLLSDTGGDILEVSVDFDGERMLRSVLSIVEV